MYACYAFEGNRGLFHRYPGKGIHMGSVKRPPPFGARLSMLIVEAAAPLLLPGAAPPAPAAAS